MSEAWPLCCACSGSGLDGRPQPTSLSRPESDPAQGTQAGLRGRLPFFWILRERPRAGCPRLPAGQSGRPEAAAWPPPARNCRLLQATPPWSSFSPAGSPPRHSPAPAAGVQAGRHGGRGDNGCGAGTSEGAPRRPRTSAPVFPGQHRRRLAVSSLRQVLGRKAGSAALCFLFELVTIWFSFIIWTSWSST